MKKKKTRRTSIRNKKYIGVIRYGIGKCYEREKEEEEVEDEGQETRRERKRRKLRRNKDGSKVRSRKQ